MKFHLKVFQDIAAQRGEKITFAVTHFSFLLPWSIIGVMENIIQQLGYAAKFLSRDVYCIRQKNICFSIVVKKYTESY